jgi:hypothetical protein
MRRLLIVPAVTVALWLFNPVVNPTTATPAVSAPTAVSFDGRQFLEFDPDGDGRAVEVLGDLAAAQRIAIVIPGADTTLANFDRGLGGVRRRAPAFQARQLYGQMRADDPAEPIAVVAWLGYDPPEGVGLAAIREDRAAAGAIALESFVDGLPKVPTTVIGHSYGSVVAGRAAPRLGPSVTDIVAIGSPGLGVHREADLHTTARVWAGTAANDWTRFIPGIRILGAGHDTRPADPEFGARRLPVDGVDGHDGYFVSGSSALRAMAQIALGETGEL